ncbi:DoxX family protein [Myxococcus sp. MISCRS1]|jgi:putative oxidoreductase|uniref:DoxX family protein n=1 Tax=Myxococcus TaxID=32 RepID=UPI001CBA9252|nr:MULTISPECIES: DoxX family protein [unclassified Myxococcus]MBZ4399164.1 DoxX family protein [Myxococcus sp. AS-1-15]MBZ4411632.1 DoxX family protein [Myxococcus sp. XM-1-1-1]MCY0999657.1 DoxX family protein [Myxococcus sp. MISCRS1]BDT30343.1 DoxX family protein [Myxococcus sp. MH1]
MNSVTLTEQPDLLKAAALLPPRLSLGSTMVVHGIAKLRKEGTEQHAGFFEQLGLKPARPLVLATGVTEVLAGVGAILGIATRPAAVAVLVTQAFAIAKVHGSKGFDNTKGGFEFNLALCAIALGLLLRGPGRLSVHSAVESKVKRKELRRFKLLPRQRRGSRLLDLLG